MVNLGAVGMDGQWLLDRLVCLGVDVAAIEQFDCPSGDGIINVAAALKVTRPGTADAILDLAEVMAPSV